jgi:hypothetical protein
MGVSMQARKAAIARCRQQIAAIVALWTAQCELPQADPAKPSYKQRGCAAE